MNLFTFRGLFTLACLGVLALYFKPWEHARASAVGVVVGKAIDAEGRGVYGATIVLRDTKGVVVGRAESEGNGSFQFDRCKPGRYRVAAAKLGVGGGERNVFVDAHIRADATIPLTNTMTAISHH
jgi:hypothetical protein